MKRRHFIGFVTGIGTTLAVPSVLTACGDNKDEFLPDNDLPDVDLPNKPNRITSTIKKDTKNCHAFNWFSAERVEDPVVLVSTSANMANSLEFSALIKEVDSYYLTRDEEGYFVFNAVNEITGENRRFTDKERQIGWTPDDERHNNNEAIKYNMQTVKEYVYNVDATKLQPNTTYYYRVGSKQGAKSLVGQFKTSATTGQAFTFIQYTDTQNTYWNEHIRNEALFCADTLRRAQTVAPNAEFILHSGDFVECAQVEDEWLDIMQQSQLEFLKMSLVVAPGNHDEYYLEHSSISEMKHKFNDHFNLDSAGPIDGGCYYSFDYNNAHFIVLNTNDNKKDDRNNPTGKALGKDQMDWLRQDVQKARKEGANWIILTYHKPLFSKSYHSLMDADVQRVRKEFMQQIDELKIDICLQGHDHVFSRTKSLQFEGDFDKSFIYSKIDDSNLMDNDTSLYQSPKGTVFIVPNTGGTKAYDAIFNKSLEHIHKVRKGLKNTIKNQQQLDHYRSLFAAGYQPQKSSNFENSHSNIRDSSDQTFAVYTIDNNLLKGEIYMVSGDLTKNEERHVRLADVFEIRKSIAS